MKRVTSGIVLSILLLAVGCNKKKEEKEEAAVYPVTTPVVMDTVINKEYVAQIQSVKNIEVRAQEKGFLEKIYVDEGQFVHAGQTLFRIMPQLYQAELMKAKAEAEQASIELQNASTLANNNIVSKNEKAMAKAKLDAARAEMRLAQIHLSFTDIKAPFSGIINRLPLKLGSLVNEGDLLTSLSDNTSIYTYFNVSEPEYLSYQTHAADRGSNMVSLIMANGEAYSQKGEIQTIEGEFNNETGNIAFRAKFLNPDKLLRNGETGKVQMTMPVHNALIIPQKATYEIQDQKYVFVVDKNGIARSRNIKVAYELPDLYVVASGISKGDQILLEGIQKVKDDQKLKTKFQDPQKVLQSLKLKAE
ncbi:efflux RND transporter periplasmic adaptor subunit [Elizabethkingia meningoseptica]|uniref:efflux RND transporter periplasmic adaptor subunit n=1 Tax=Elizabethkingia meningoseptica TaxID=238 RepID=UPI0023B1B992|nr:efflux RND transporter periplasmic adaptor subunit [Elizabethkingia meningoseptica]MDE5438752.1 efflux RND transporter periplasmic adaptor subunit [Elizabethkingia meningoseptica]MDE5507887.1 efflux RND transporter periplasmic adaptor subunit [Elizabethkingia meningoseptica]MDE5516245.1 efflux RND transporter periplasmic adaptor subunit [Elizabethkingia meningoseptica]MDE5530555.1 efflux RND transporter periplasmic adaptor subunit [Elizabethkingia meningoseptica]MDE5534112.1 efflux RND tran